MLWSRRALAGTVPRSRHRTDDDGFFPRNLDVSLLSGDMAGSLAAQGGLFRGLPGGCDVAAALKVAPRDPDLTSIVAILPESTQRCFTTALRRDVKSVKLPGRDHAIDPHTLEQLDRYPTRREIIT